MPISHLTVPTISKAWKKPCRHYNYKSLCYNVVQKNPLSNVNRSQTEILWFHFLMGQWRKNEATEWDRYPHAKDSEPRLAGRADTYHILKIRLVEVGCMVIMLILGVDTNWLDGWPERCTWWKQRAKRLDTELMDTTVIIFIIYLESRILTLPRISHKLGFAHHSSNMLRTWKDVPATTSTTNARAMLAFHTTTMLSAIRNMKRDTENITPTEFILGCLVLEHTGFPQEMELAPLDGRERSETGGITSGWGQISDSEGGLAAHGRT